MSLTQTATVLGGAMRGADAVFTGVATDSRNLAKGDLFVALVGPHHDGHHYVEAAAQAGAVGALLSRDIETELPYVCVADTRKALGRLAGHWRRRFSMPLVAVTGSNGKTTAKEMLGQILAVNAPALVTRGNLNNDIGVPLTLLRLRQEHRSAVIEMGMNHPGEIRYLTEIAAPTIAMITNAAEAHLAGLGSVKAVAMAKGEILEGLAEDGVAVLNADDEYFDYWRSCAGEHRVISFGLEHKADVTADYQLGTNGSSLQLQTTQGEIDMRLPLLGKHNVLNALASAAAALSAGASLADIKTGIERLKAVSGRLEAKRGINGAHIIDDTYNANPASVSAGLEVLKQAQGERVLVLGDMGELGDAAGMIHHRVGELAKRVGVSRMFCLGELSREAVRGFGNGARHYDDAATLMDDLADCMHDEMTVLVKGSRAMHMDRVVKGVIEPRGV